MTSRENNPINMLDLKKMFLETNIFLIRHGETEWNKLHRLQGSKNSPLTSNGIKQANQVKKLIQQVNIDQAYVSPLKRARDTINIILKDSKLEPVIVNDLREIDLGPWEGMSQDKTALLFPDEHLAFWEKPDEFNLDGAETFQALQKRMLKVLESIFISEKNKNILVVSHWIAIKVILAHYTSTPLSQLSEIANPENGALLCLSNRSDGIFFHQIKSNNSFNLKKRGRGYE